MRSESIHRHAVAASRRKSNLLRGGEVNQCRWLKENNYFLDKHGPASAPGILSAIRGGLP
jgi:hypothetical protein